MRLTAIKEQLEGNKYSSSNLAQDLTTDIGTPSIIFLFADLPISKFALKFKEKLQQIGDDFRRVNVLGKRQQGTRGETDR